MSSTFNFHGPTTFIDRPKDTVIKDFQNLYTTGNNQSSNDINMELLKLVELILTSKDLSKEDKNDSVDALHKLAAEVKEEKVNKLTAKGTLDAVKEIVSKTSDVLAPAMAIIKTVLPFFA